MVYQFDRDIVNKVDDNSLVRRPVSLSDSDEILRWRNDPSTIITTRVGEPIQKNDHNIWTSERIKRHNDEPYFAYLIGEVLVAIVRLDSVVEGFEFSILVSPEWRGKKIATRVMVDILDFTFANYPEKKIIAWVKNSNKRSMNLFRNRGFHLTLKQKEFTKFQYGN